MAGPFDSHIASLHPQLRNRAAAFLAEALSAGLDPRVQEGYRSRERQAQLYAQGRTAPGAIVTKAGPGQSNHNYGVAFDVVPGSLLAQKNWAPESPLWAQLGEIGQRHGLEWGGTWDFVDKPHFQLQGASWRRMRNDPAFASWRPDGAVPAAQGVGSMYAGAAPAQAGAGAPTGAQAPSGLAAMFGPAGSEAAAGGSTMGNIATNYLQQFAARTEQRRQEEEAEQAKREALLGMSLDVLYG